MEEWNKPFEIPYMGSMTLWPDFNTNTSCDEFIVFNLQPICKINTWRADSVVLRSEEKQSELLSLSLQGSGLKPCWLKLNPCVICSALSNTPDFVRGWMAKIEMSHRCCKILSLFTFFLFGLSTFTVAFPLFHFTNVYQISPPLLFVFTSPTVIQRHKAKSKGCIFISLGGKQQSPNRLQCLLPAMSSLPTAQHITLMGCQWMNWGIRVI